MIGKAHQRIIREKKEEEERLFLPFKKEDVVLKNSKITLIKRKECVDIIKNY